MNDIHKSKHISFLREQKDQLHDKVRLGKG